MLACHGEPTVYISRCSLFIKKKKRKKKHGVKRYPLRRGVTAFADDALAGALKSSFPVVVVVVGGKRGSARAVQTSKKGRRKEKRKEKKRKRKRRR